MPMYDFKAIDAKGKESVGSLSADNRGAAVNLVIQRGFTPVVVQEHGKADAPIIKSPTTGRPPQAQIDNFTRELANLLNAAVPLSRALTIIVREATHPVARAQWTIIHDDVVGGASLAETLSRFPNTFPSVYVAMVHAGETGGFLDVVLSQIADFQQREEDLKGKVKAALIYPAVLASLAVAVLIFLLTYFIPRFTIVFKDFGGSLPWLTQMIVAASNGILKHGPVALVILCGALFGLKRLAETESGQMAIDRFMIKVPLLGQVVVRFALIRFLRMLGTLLGAGVGLIEALKVAKEAVGNRVMTETVARAIDDVQKGSSLSKSLSTNSKLFPPSIAEMVAVAEETSRLDKELQRMSIAMESDLDRRLRMLVALAEPLLLFMMASVIGTIVVGMLLPLFQLQDLVK